LGIVASEGVPAIKVLRSALDKEPGFVFWFFDASHETTKVF
jgi:hypothetical protein